LLKSWQKFINPGSAPNTPGSTPSTPASVPSTPGSAPATPSRSNTSSGGDNAPTPPAISSPTAPAKSDVSGALNGGGLPQSTPPLCRRTLLANHSPKATGTSTRANTLKETLTPKSSPAACARKTFSATPAQSPSIQSPGQVSFRGNGYRDRSVSPKPETPILKPSNLRGDKNVSPKSSTSQHSSPSLIPKKVTFNCVEKIVSPSVPRKIMTSPSRFSRDSSTTKDIHSPSGPAVMTPKSMLLNKSKPIVNGLVVSPEQNEHKGRFEFLETERERERETEREREEGRTDRQTQFKKNLGVSNWDGSRQN
jgi:hypothetical protein